MIVIPLIYFIAQYLLIKLIETKKIRKRLRLVKMIESFIDVGLKEIFVNFIIMRLIFQESIEQMGHRKYARVVQKSPQPFIRVKTRNQAVQTNPVNISEIDDPQQTFNNLGHKTKVFTKLLADSNSNYNSTTMLSTPSDQFKEFISRKIIMNNTNDLAIQTNSLDAYLKMKIITNYPKKDQL